MPDFLKCACAQELYGKRSDTAVTAVYSAYLVYLGYMNKYNGKETPGYGAYFFAGGNYVA